MNGCSCDGTCDHCKISRRKMRFAQTPEMYPSQSLCSPRFGLTDHEAAREDWIEKIHRCDINIYLSLEEKEFAEAQLRALEIEANVKGDENE